MLCASVLTAHMRTCTYFTHVHMCTGNWTVHEAALAYACACMPPAYTPKHTHVHMCTGNWTMHEAALALAAGGSHNTHWLPQ